MLESIPKDAYIEIYDYPMEMGLEELDRDDDAFGKVARNILSLGIDRVHFENRPGGYPKYLPDISKDRPVCLGGAWGEQCVMKRYEAYGEAGFADVRVVPELTVYEAEQKEFERLTAIKIQQKLESLLVRVRR